MKTTIMIALLGFALVACDRSDGKYGSVRDVDIYPTAQELLYKNCSRDINKNIGDLKSVYNIYKQPEKFPVVVRGGQSTIYIYFAELNNREIYKATLLCTFDDETGFRVGEIKICKSTPENCSLQ